MNECRFESLTCFVFSLKADNSFDFVFTSPPFFDYEMYSPENPDYRGISFRALQRKNDVISALILCHIFA